MQKSCTCKRTLRDVLVTSALSAAPESSSFLLICECLHSKALTCSSRLEEKASRRLRKEETTEDDEEEDMVTN